MSDTKAQSPIEKVIEIVRRPHPDISGEHMEDILAIAKQAAAELAELKRHDAELEEYHGFHMGIIPEGEPTVKELELRAELDEARELIETTASPYPYNHELNVQLCRDWLSAHPKDGDK